MSAPRSRRPLGKSSRTGGESTCATDKGLASQGVTVAIGFYGNESATSLAKRSAALRPV